MIHKEGVHHSVSAIKHCHSSDTQQAHPCVLDRDIWCKRIYECRDHMDVKERPCHGRSLTWQCLILPTPTVIWTPSYKHALCKFKDGGSLISISTDISIEPWIQNIIDTITTVKKMPVQSLRMPQCLIDLTQMWMVWQTKPLQDK